MWSENARVSLKVICSAWKSWHGCRKPTYKNLGLVANRSFVVPRTEKVRKVLLELDDTASTVESERIKCRSCQQWVPLEQRYSLKGWAAHKSACNNNLEYIISYHVCCLLAHSVLSPTDIERTLERKLYFFCDIQFKRFLDPHSVECAACGRGIALNPDVDYDIETWLSHKKDCQPCVSLNLLLRVPQLKVLSVVLGIIRIRRLLRINRRLPFKGLILQALLSKQNQLRSIRLYPYLKPSQRYLVQKASWRRLKQCRQQIVNEHLFRLLHPQLQDHQLRCHPYLLCYPLQLKRQVIMSSSASASLLQTNLGFSTTLKWMKSSLSGAHAWRVTPQMMKTLLAA